MRTQVGIVGAGPAGLMLSHLLHRAGISSVIVESRSRAYCEARIRAGLIEQWAADMLVETGVGARMKRESMVHDGIYLCFDGSCTTSISTNWSASASPSTASRRW